ncbi:MAG TPA: hypothetical protein VGP07_22840 [Polyangia bacterium]
MRSPRALRLLPLLGVLAGCDDSSHRDIQDEINILTRRNDALVAPATQRLARYGRLAIPLIETAIHTAAPTGRLHLIDAFGVIGDDDAVPVLRHFAIYDVRSEVRRACEDLLDRWATDRGGSSSVHHRAERATAAQAEIARKRAAGEAPLVFQDGTPGAPTVGAPEPVGSELEKTIR